MRFAIYMTLECKVLCGCSASGMEFRLQKTRNTDPLISVGCATRRFKQPNHRQPSS
jgi:hypothetical protein